MSPFVLIVVVLVIGGGELPGLAIDPVAACAAALAQPLIAAVAVTLIVRAALRRLDGAGRAAGADVGWTLRRADRGVRLVRGVVLAAHAGAILAFGWTDVVRQRLGDLVLIDELVAMFPPLLALAVTWWCWYPLERRLRDAESIARVASGGGVVLPARSRGAWMALQVRMQVLLMLLPILLAVGGLELLDRAWRLWEPALAPGWRDAAAVATVAAVLVVSPLLVRLVLGARSLPGGTLREGLMAIGRRHRVRIRDCLLWPTDGAVLNGAVVGVLPGLRYVLLTDALLAELPPPQLHAVMAHEIGHLRRRHLPLALLTIIAIGAALGTAVDALRRLVESGAPEGEGWLPALESALSSLGPGPVEILLALGGAGIVLGLFGWVSRRLERQADTFAVVHLSEVAGADRVLPEAVDAMCDALESVAAPGAIDPERRSWRHGSIRWRQAYLRGLVGRPTRRLPIDAAVRRITLGALTILALSVAGRVELWAR
ncbi:MAG TPA: M48 family metallopeptidase [Phycisphaerales bacterium]|nr:M48 family metallopeptidase [Phycisphaerales bacterium]HMP36564.1 M48 family metallopeptidase [Phycisphaerales bacterium]